VGKDIETRYAQTKRYATRAEGGGKQKGVIPLETQGIDKVWDREQDGNVVGITGYNGRARGCASC
jgi:hypothetical protein